MRSSRRILVARGPGRDGTPADLAASCLRAQLYTELVRVLSPDQDVVVKLARKVPKPDALQMCTFLDGSAAPQSLRTSLLPAA